MTEQAAAVTFGHPSYLWTRGLDRRLQLVRRHVPLEGGWILDIGCGIGTWLRQFHDFSSHVYGIEIDSARAQEAGRSLPGICQARAESIPFADNTFDVVFLHEVIEHVSDDRGTIEEAVRCTRPGGHVVIFAPNRLYPFETHGFFLGDRFVFRLLPLINYAPDFIRNRFCRVGIYTRRGIKRLFAGLEVDFTVCSHVYPGFDHIARRNPALGRLLQHMAEMAERSPLRALGISHFIVARKGGGQHLPLSRS